MSVERRTEARLENRGGKLAAVAARTAASTGMIWIVLCGEVVVISRGGIAIPLSFIRSPGNSMLPIETVLL